MKAMARPSPCCTPWRSVIGTAGTHRACGGRAPAVLAFDYISASGVPVLDVICSILTGSAFVAFLFAAGLALCVSTAGAVLDGALASRAEGDLALAARPRPLTAFLWGWATALVALACLVVVVLGILLGGAGGIHVLEAAGTGRSSSSASSGSRPSSARFWGGLHGGVCRRGSLARRAQPGAFAHRGGGFVRGRRRSAHGRHLIGPERGEHQPAGAGRLVRGGCRGKCGHALRVRRPNAGRMSLA